MSPRSCGHDGHLELCPTNRPNVQTPRIQGSPGNASLSQSLPVSLSPIFPFCPLSPAAALGYQGEHDAASQTYSHSEHPTGYEGVLLAVPSSFRNTGQKINWRSLGVGGVADSGGTTMRRAPFRTSTLRPLLDTINNLGLDTGTPKFAVRLIYFLPCHPFPFSRVCPTTVHLVPGHILTSDQTDMVPFSCELRLDAT
ncbi:hypothetical protein LZ30DRAFT_446212 [Colletotrichum cereale]|nr:hypothetical protein LZ30DRAFT_446212 [Colletotrichum cereale]